MPDPILRPSDVEKFRDPALIRRLVERSMVDENGCWVIDGHLTTGYGLIAWEGERYLAHRASYYAFVGDVPEGLDLDHLCRNRTCINPKHLEPVTRSENLLRGKLGYELGGTCRNGHLLTPDTLEIGKGARGTNRCRTCRRATVQRYEEKRRGTRIAA
jgi:hypothetical protein